MLWCLGLLYARKVTACACLISTKVLGFSSSIKGNSDLSYSGELNTELPPVQLCGVMNSESCLTVVQAEALDVKYLPFLSDPEEVAYIRAKGNVSSWEPTASSEGVLPAEGSEVPLLSVKAQSSWVDELMASALPHSIC